MGAVGILVILGGFIAGSPFAVCMGGVVIIAGLAKH
jgi:hypothetical protein